MTTSDSVRRVAFDADGPVEVTVNVGTGTVDVELREAPGVEVEIRPGPSGGNPLTEGLSGLMSWVAQLSEPQKQPQSADPSAEAVSSARVDFGGGSLMVRPPKGGHLRSVPLSVRVSAPEGSTVSVRAESAPVTVTGRADRVDAGTGGGALSVERATGAVKASTGTGPIRLGPAPAGAEIRTGGGDVDAESLGGTSTVATTTGEVRLGKVSGDVNVRTGTGDIAIAEAATGSIDLNTASGDIRVGVTGPAEFDLTAVAGTARTEVPVTQARPSSTPPLRVAGRTASGSILVHKSRS